MQTIDDVIPPVGALAGLTLGPWQPGEAETTIVRVRDVFWNPPTPKGIYRRITVSVCDAPEVHYIGAIYISDIVGNTVTHVAVAWREADTLIACQGLIDQALASWGVKLLDRKTHIRNRRRPRTRPMGTLYQGCAYGVTMGPLLRLGPESCREGRRGNTYTFNGLFIEDAWVGVFTVSKFRGRKMVAFHEARRFFGSEQAAREWSEACAKHCGVIISR